MFKDTVDSQIIGVLKITDKDTGEVLVQKRNAIHPGNMAYVMALALACQSSDLAPTAGAPCINWMAFGNGGSVSTTTLSYRSPRVYGTYDGQSMLGSASRLYAQTYTQQTENVVYYPGQVLDDAEIIPPNTSKINFRVDVSHLGMAAATGEDVPESDSSTDLAAVEAFTIDEIGLVTGVTTAGALDEATSLLLTHVTFHPVLLSENRSIIVDYTITIQIS